jgi:hypothetical protein
MPSTICIRPRRLEDGRAITELFSRPGFRYRGTAELCLIQGATEAASIEVVAVGGFEVLGYAGLFGLDDRDRCTKSIHMGTLMVCRGRGVADAMLRALATALPEAKTILSRVELTVYVVDGVSRHPSAALGLIH